MQRPIFPSLAIVATSVMAAFLPSFSFAQVDDLELPAEPIEEDTSNPSPTASATTTWVPSPTASASGSVAPPPAPVATVPPPAPAPTTTGASLDSPASGTAAVAVPATSTAETTTAAESTATAEGDNTATPVATAIALERNVHSRPVGLGLKFGGYLQAQFVQDQISEDQLQQDGTPQNRDEFSLRAARLRVDSGYEYTAYAFELDATTVNGLRVGIRRAEAMLLYRGENTDELPPLIGVTAGVIDVPFGYELVESSGSRYFMERTTASEALSPTQTDAGVKLFGAWQFLRYAVGFVNGEPVSSDTLRDPNAKKDTVGRLGAEADVGQVVRVAGGTSFAFGKGFHAGRVAEKDSLAWRDDNEDGVATPGELIGVPGSSATPSESFERWAIGLDVGFQLATPIGLTRLLAEGYVASNHDRGLYVADPVETGIDVRHLGGYVAVTQGLSPYAIVGFRASLYDPNSDFLEQRRGDLVPRSQEIVTLSPLVGLTLPGRARLLFQYDFVDDSLARDRVGVPTDAENNRLTARLQVDL